MAVLLHSTLVLGVSKLCGVEQRASPIFGRATITLGIGQHSSVFAFWATVCIYKNSSGDEIANVNFFYNIAHVEASAYAH